MASIACGGAAGDGASAPTFTEHLPPTSQLEDPQPITRVVDGDTLEIELDGEPETIRVKGVNTPELYSEPPEAWSSQARDFTLSLVGTEIDVIFDSACGANPLQSCRDDYDRLLAYVRVASGADLGAELLERGLARIYIWNNEHFDRRTTYEGLQAAAQSANRGLWSDE
jgi:micrococcal nuclease